MSNQPDQPQPYPGQEASQIPVGPVPAGYYAPPVPPDPAPAAPQTYQGPSPAPQSGAPAHYQDAPGFAAPNYAAPNYGTANYANPNYAMPVYAPTGPRGLSLSSMIVGLGSLLLLGFLIVPQVVGVILGHMGIKREDPQGRGFAITGLITNYLAIAIWGGLYLFMTIVLTSY